MVIPDRTLKGDVNIPQLGIGTWQLKGEACTNAVKMAIEAGYRHIDTAEIYGNEVEVGKGIVESGIDRSELFITSKCWTEHAGAVEDALRASLERLGVEYLDLYLIHWPTDEVPIEETIATLDSCREKGLIRAFGVSNYGPKNLQRALDASSNVAMNQVEFHPFLYQKDLLELCEENGVVLTAYSPIGRGAVIGNEVLESIGKAHGKSAVQVTLRWIIDKGVVAIPKATSEAHIRANLDIFDFELSEEETASIDALNENKRFVDPGFADWS